MTPRQPPPGYIIEPLGAPHDRSSFSCGIPPLDRYLQQQAGQDAVKGVSRTYVLVGPDRVTIAGFYALSAASIPFQKLPEDIARRLPRYPSLPATLLARLAVSLAHRGVGFGEILLLNALHRSLEHSLGIGSAFVVVDAKNETARAFYQRYGFQELRDGVNQLFLPMRSVRPLFP